MAELNDGFRVITQEETPLFRARVTLFDLQARGVVGVVEPVVFERYVVPVYDGDKPHKGCIGSAHLYYSDFKINATLILDFHSPERFDLEVDLPVYATPEGSYYLRGMDLRMDYVDITGLTLTTKPIDANSVLVHRG